MKKPHHICSCQEFKFFLMERDVLNILSPIPKVTFPRSCQWTNTTDTDFTNGRFSHVIPFQVRSVHMPHGDDLWIGPLHCYYWWMDLKPCLQEIQYTKRFTDIYGYFWRLNSRFINSKLRIETSNCALYVVNLAISHDHME